MCASAQIDSLIKTDQRRILPTAPPPPAAGRISQPEQASESIFSRYGGMRSKRTGRGATDLVRPLELKELFAASVVRIILLGKTATPELKGCILTHLIHDAGERVAKVNVALTLPVTGVESMNAGRPLLRQ